MNIKAAWQWLDRLTAWGFIVGLCGWMYYLFMVQLPESMFHTRLNADYPGDIIGGLFGIAPYIFYVSACFFARWVVDDYPFTYHPDRTDAVMLFFILPALYQRRRIF
ncbi:MAG: hypothetical protein RSD49_02450 [Hafnia sp.]